MRRLKGVLWKMSFLRITSKDYVETVGRPSIEDHKNMIHLINFLPDPQFYSMKQSSQ